MKRPPILPLLLGLLLMPSAPLCAGIYNPAEPPIAMEKDPYIFLAQQMPFFRTFGPPDPLTTRSVPAQREDYLNKVRALRQTQSTGTLTADELASLGAYLIRLRRTQQGTPDLEEAIQVLEAARRQHPRHFMILANLGTAYQITGRLDIAERTLQEAEAVAPDDQRTLTRYQHRLVRLRQNEQLTLGLAPLDNLFADGRSSPVKFVAENGSWQVGVLAAAEKAKLPRGSPDEALAIVQQLLICFPDDARLHWLLGELANAKGDLKAAALAMNLAVYDFRLSTRELRQRRQSLNEAAAWLSYFERIGDAKKLQVWLGDALAAGMQSAGPLPDPFQVALTEKRLVPLSKAFGEFGEEDQGPKESPALAAWEAPGWKAYAIVGVGGGLILLLLLGQLWQGMRRKRRAA